MAWKTEYAVDKPEKLNGMVSYCWDCAKRAPKSILAKQHRGHNVEYVREDSIR